MNTIQKEIPLLRLGLVGFSPDEAAELAQLVQQVQSSRAPWIVVADLPYDGILLARGTRAGDTGDSAVLRINLPLPIPGDGDRRRTPLRVRKPIRELTLKVALEAAFLRYQVFSRELKQAAVR
jgi:hypothetical protein